MQPHKINIEFARRTAVTVSTPEGPPTDQHAAGAKTLLRLYPLCHITLHSTSRYG